MFVCRPLLLKHADSKNVMCVLFLEEKEVELVKMCVANNLVREKIQSRLRRKYCVATKTTTT